MEPSTVIYLKLNGVDNGEYNFYRAQHVEDYIGRCYTCLAPRSPDQPPKRCSGCQLVAYCSSVCQTENWPEHKYVCKEFPVVNGENALHTTGLWKEHMASLIKRASGLKMSYRAIQTIFSDPWVCHTCREPRPDLLRDCKCSCVCYCSKKCADADRLHKEGCTHFTFIAQNYSLYYVQSSYPESLAHALNLLPEFKTTKTITIHAISSNPTFDSEAWELHFVHHYPKVMNFELVFIAQGNNSDMSVEESFRNTHEYVRLPLCEGCKSKNIRLIWTYKKMQYHMFSSMLSYTEPDVVVVFGNTHEMLTDREDNIHSEMSYRNMIYSQNTILVLTDATEDLVTQGIKAVNDAQPVDVLVTPRINRARGFSSTRAELESGTEVINEKYYFTCLTRKK